MKIHWASKILYLFLGIILAGLLGFLGGAEGEEWYLIVPARRRPVLPGGQDAGRSVQEKGDEHQKGISDFVSGLCCWSMPVCSTRQAIDA